MSYYDTIDEDLKRAREILERGKAEPPHLPMPDHVAFFGGTIYGGDLSAAYMLLDSFVKEIERLQEDLVELAVTSHRTEQRLRAEVSSPASQLDLELRAIAGHLCNMEKEFPSTCKAIRQCIARLEPHDD